MRSHLCGCARHHNLPAAAAAVRSQIDNPIRRANHFLGRRIRSAGWHRDKVLRLFDRAKGAYEPLHVHADLWREQRGFRI